MNCPNEEIERLKKNLNFPMGEGYIRVKHADVSHLLQWVNYLESAHAEAYHPEFGTVPELQEQIRQLRQKLSQEQMRVHDLEHAQIMHGTIAE